MDEDQILQSIIADPQLTDPSIDTSGLRTTTDTRAELLANVPEFSGLKYDFTNRDYIRDLYSVYGGGLPTIPEPVVEDTAQIPGAVDTLVDVGGGSGQDQATGDSVLDTPTITTPTITQPAGGGADMGTVPATGQTGDGSITVENIAQNQTPYDVPMDIDDPGASIENIIAQQNLSTIPEAPVINQNLQTQGPTTVDFSTGEMLDADAQNIGNIYDEVALTGASPEQQNLVSKAFSKVGSTANDIMRDLSEIPGAIANFVDKTVDIAGQKINVGGTLLRAGINRIAGGPISLVFDAIQAIAPQDSLANTTTRSIVDELKASGKDYGFNMQSGNLNQDPFGRNPVSAFGDYEGTLINDINNPSDTKMGNAKKEFAQDYFDAKAERAGGVEVDDGTVLGPGEAPGETVSLDQLQAAEEKEQREAFADIQNQIGQTRDQDPAPAPAAPAPAPSYSYSGGGGRDSGGGGGGGGGGSPGSAGPGGSDEMGSF
jgi:hypothetical protein